MKILKSIIGKSFFTRLAVLMMLPVVLLFGCWSMVYGAGHQRLSSTEGDEFWVAYLNNYQALSGDASLDLEIIVTASESVTVTVDAADGSRIGQLQVLSAGGWDTLKIDPTFVQMVYPEQMVGQPTGAGIHVYTTEEGKTFTCYAYNRMGLTGSSSRDASLVLPSAALGTEYVVQTYRDETMSSEIAIVATEDGTRVYITPTKSTKSALPMNPVMMSRGEVLFVESQTASEDAPDVDLSGTLVCADKPIAVFAGNEGAAVPERVEGNAGDHAYEQVMPIDKLGTEFYIGRAKNTSVNAYYVTAAYDETDVTLRYHDLASGQDAVQTVRLNRGESLLERSDPSYPMVYRVDNDGWMENVKIESTKPVIVYDYLSMPSSNSGMEGRTRYQWGDGASAMVAAWSHRLKHATFYTKLMDPQYANKSIQRHFVHIVTRTADVGTFTLTNSDGTTTAVSASDFTAFTADATMSYASIEVPKSGGHTISTTGQGFVGFVYGVGEGLSYQYTLTFNPMPGLDSLYVTTSGETMSPSYDLERQSQGWYQRQQGEYANPNEAHWDTVRVCDGATVPFAVDLGKYADTVRWRVYEMSIDGSEPIAEQTDVGRSEGLHSWSRQFTLRNQDELLPPQRDPYTLYELEVVTARKHLVCEELPAEYDTLKTLIQVTRIYKDTVKRVICMGDTAYFYYDKIEGGDYVVPHDGSSLDSTMFVSGAVAGAHKEGYVGGVNSYSRQYETLYGCDSLVTYELYVCDTFRTVIDTSWCENRLSELHVTDKLSGGYFGKTDAVYYDTLKTKGCDYWYIDRNFEGCDSIIELHLHVAPSPVTTKYRTWCSTDTAEIFYEWIVGYNWEKDANDTVWISSKDPRFQETGSSSNKKKVGLFADTMKTRTCADCPGGSCDSIFRLQLTIPLSINKNYYESICDSLYDATTHTLYKNESFRWRSHPVEDTKQLWNNTTGTHVRADSLTYLPPLANDRSYQIIDTLPGQMRWDEEQQDYVKDCDTTYTLNLKVKATRLEEKTITIPDNVTYTWTRTAAGVTHTDVVGPFSADESPYLFVDSIGICSSVYECSCYDYFHLRVIIASNFYYEEVDSICDNETWTWATHRCGHQADTVFRDMAAGTYVIWDSLRTTSQPMETDSVYRLTLTVSPTYRQDDTLRMCDKDVLVWQGLTIAGDKADQTGVTADRVYAHGEHKDTARYQTVAGCDSMYYLVLYVDESFYQEEDSTMCQDGAFVWTNHRAIPSGLGAGTYVFYDSLRTVQGCDSVYRLNLTVRASYIGDRVIVEEDTVCASEGAYEWTGHTDEQGRVLQFTESGTYQDSLTTVAGCDSVMELRLVVIADTTQRMEIAVCQNDEPFYFGSQQHYVSPADSVPGVRTVSAVVGIAGGCSYEEILTIRINESYYFNQKDTICQDTVQTEYIWTDEAGHMRATRFTRAHAGTFLLYDSIETAAGCDSIYRLELTILPSYYWSDTLKMSNEDTLHWQGVVYGGSATTLPHDVRIVGGDTTIVTHYATVGAGGLSCDSTIELYLRQGKIYRDTKYDFTCSNEPYTWTRPAVDGSGDSIVMSGLTEAKTYVDRHTTTLGYDSVFFLVLDFYPTYLEAEERTTRDSICQGYDYTWVDHKIIPAGLGVGEYVFYDSLKTAAHGCDSIWTLRLRVDSVYDYTDRITICSNDTLDWQGFHILGLSAGDYTYDTIRKTVHGCDSTYHLMLHVNPAYLEVASTDTTYHTICDNDTLVFYGGTYNKNGEWVSPTHAVQRFELSYMDTTREGCDSMAVHVVTVHPTYLYHTPDTATCRFVPFVWEGHENRNLYLVETGEWTDSIAVGQTGTFHYIDSLKTQTCGACHSGAGCDSVWTLTLTVHPVGRSDSSYVVCSNDVITWQRRLFVGHDYDTVRWGVPAEHTAAWDSIIWLPDTLHYADTAKYQNEFGCDVIFYLELRIDTMAYTRLRESICDNDSTWTFGHGRWYHTSAEFYPENYQDYRADRQVVLLDSLHSAVTGCDSIVELTLDIYPSYRFDTTITTCSNTITPWRHNPAVNYWPTGTYYDTVKTSHGCDSVFVLHLNSIPSFYSRQTQWICKNDTLEWQHQKIFYKPENERDVFTTYTVTYSTGERCDSTYILDVYYFDWYTMKDTDVICGNQPYYWRGRTITEPGTYYDSLRTVQCGCDSIFIITLYHHPVYLFERYDSICRNEEFEAGDYVIDDTLYTIYGCDSIYRQYLHVSPDYAFDDVFTFRDDSVYVWQGQRYAGLQAGGTYGVGEYWDTVRYTSAFGCDSIYRAHFTVYYEDYDTTRVFCTGEETSWHGRTYTALYATTIYDTIRTFTTWGNDSTFYFRVRFNQSYYYPATANVCVDEGYENWHGKNIDSLVARVWAMTNDTTVTYWDSCVSVFGCDSVYSLTLTVRPITYSEIWDTLCIGDAYPFHERYLTEEGIYVDTGLNIYGCKHIETLYLTRIDPREYSIEVTEVCADGGGYYIGVRCGVRQPVTYSIIYDENDQLENIVSKVYDDSLIMVPIPMPETRQQYVRPDWYHAKLYLEGVCVDNEIVAQQYDLLIRYPSWIIEQHWNDAIGILVPELNGGYSFSAYQWYQNDEVLVGETDSYLFQPHYLEDGGLYYVALTREGEDYAIPTCPIRTEIGPDDPLMPTTPYISVVPTIVEKENPVVYILSPNEGDYYIYDPHGTLYKSGSFQPDDHAAADLRVPSVPGMYIIRLKDVTGLRRDVKILVK